LQGVEGEWSVEALVDACSGGRDECEEAVRRFLEWACGDRGRCESRPGRRGLASRYRWVEALIERGVPDGRARLILYVVSRYLVNVKGLSPEEALLEVKRFLDASCRRHGNCGKIYDSWIRNVLRRVGEGGWLPWGLERLRERDPELYEVVAGVLEEG